MGKPREKNDGRGRMGGRQKGTPNKVTGLVRETLASVIVPYIGGEGLGKAMHTLERDLENLLPEERVKAVALFAPYCMPKLSSIEVKDKTQRKTYQDELDEAADE